MLWGVDGIRMEYTNNNNVEVQILKSSIQGKAGPRAFRLGTITCSDLRNLSKFENCICFFPEKNIGHDAAFAIQTTDLIKKKLRKGRFGDDVLSFWGPVLNMHHIVETCVQDCPGMYSTPQNEPRRNTLKMFSRHSTYQSNMQTNWLVPGSTTYVHLDKHCTYVFICMHINADVLVYNCRYLHM